jgi:uncharacterized protein YacL
MSAPAKLGFSSKSAVLLPDVDSEDRLGIRRLDLQRLERKISSGYQQQTIWTELYTIFIGLVIGALLNLLTIFFTPNVPFWIIVLMLCVVFFSSIISYITYKFKDQITKNNNNYCVDLINELKEIQKPFQKSESLP